MGVEEKKFIHTELVSYEWTSQWIIHFYKNKHARRKENLAFIYTMNSLIIAFLALSPSVPLLHARVCVSVNINVDPQKYEWRNSDSLPFSLIASGIAECAPRKYYWHICIWHGLLKYHLLNRIHITAFWHEKTLES